MTHLAASYKGQRTDQNALEIQNHDQSMDRGCSKTKGVEGRTALGIAVGGKGPQFSLHQQLLQQFGWTGLRIREKAWFRPFTRCCGHLYLRYSEPAKSCSGEISRSSGRLDTTSMEDSR